MKGLSVVKCIVIKLYNIPLLSFKYLQNLYSDASFSFLILVIFYKIWCQGLLMWLTLKRQQSPLWPFLCKASGGPFRICFYLGEPGKENCYKMMSFKSSQEIITYMLKKYLEDWTFLLINSGGINLKKRGIMGLRALS